MLLGMRQGLTGSDPSPVINWDFLQSQSLTSFSRTSNATLFDSTGKLTYAPNNLLLNTATLSTQTVTTGLQAGVSVILSFSGTGSVAISGGYTGSLAGTGVSDRVSLKFTTTTNSLTFTVTGSVTSAQLEVVTYQTTPSTYTATTSSQYYGPRYPYAYNGTTWDAQGLLVEAAGTNLVGYSEAFDNAYWTKARVNAPDADVAVSPSGVQNAEKVTVNGTSAPYVYKLLSSLGASKYTFSVYAKKGTSSGWVYLVIGSGATYYYAWFDLTNGVKGSTSGGGSGLSGAGHTITNCGNGWFRISISVITTSTYSLENYIGVDATGDGTENCTNANFNYFWGAQLEAGDLSSYIPNLATGTTTRNADTSLAFSAISLPTGLSFSRASNAMQYDAAGRLTYAPNNLLLNTATLSGYGRGGNIAVPTTGVADPVGGTNAITLRATGSGTWNNINYIFTTASASAGSNCVVSVWVRRRTGSGNVILTNQNGTQGPTLALTSSWQQFSVAGPVSASSGIVWQIDILTSGDEIDIYLPVGALVTYETVPRPCDQVITTSSAYYGPRYDYDPLTRLPKGLLIEEGRTNVIADSGDINSGNWSQANAVRSNDGTKAPDNAGSFIKITAAAASSTQIVFQSRTLTANTTYTMSVYVKYANSRYVSLLWQGNTFNRWAAAVFDIGSTSNTAATQTAFGSSSGTITSTSQQYIGNGIFRLSLTASVNDTSVYFICQFAGAATGNTFTGAGYINVTTAGTEAFYLWGAQLEAGSFPTSYIPNPGIASGIRSADLPDSTNATVIGCKTFLVETSGMQAATTATILGLNAGIGLGATTGNTLTTAFGGTQTTTATATWTGTVRSGIAWGASKVSITFNGNAVTTAANATSALTTTSFGHTNNSGTRGAFMNGWMRKVAGYSSALSDASLATKSTVGANF